MSRVLLITSNHLRHRYLAAQLSTHFDVAGILAESKPEKNLASKDSPIPGVRRYFEGREEAERHYFGHVTPFPLSEREVLSVKWGDANSTKAYEWVKRLRPEWIVLFGSSIIKDPLLSHYKNKIINMHLGLSPYYRGSSTNFWPLVDGLPECVGVTVHHAVLSVDAGPILAQGRPDIAAHDRSHDFGCKTIMKGAQLVIKTLKLMERAHVPGVVQTGEGKLCRREDFRPEMILKLEENLDRGMVPEYLAHKKARDRRFPIVLLRQYPVPEIT